MACASGALPVAMLTNPPAWMIRSRGERSTIRSRSTGKARARHGSITISSPSLKLRMCSWQVAVPAIGPWATPLIITPHDPQMPSRQSWSNAIGRFALVDQPLVDDVQHFEERHVGADVAGLVADQAARGAGTRLAPHVQGQVHHL